MSDKQCSSCGGFCGNGGCKKEPIEQEAWSHVNAVARAYANGWNAALAQFKPLTDKEIEMLLVPKHIVRLIETAHGIHEP